MLKEVAIDSIGMILTIELNRLVDSILDLILIDINLKDWSPEITKTVVDQ
jgi:hypothetical protein